MKASLRFHRQQPRKTRLIADFVRGKRVTDVLDELRHLNKKGASAFAKLIESAVANANVQTGAAKENLMVKEVQVQKGITFKRFMPRARGRATPIRKRTSHISIVLGEQSQMKNAKGKNKKKEVAKETKQ